MVMYTLLYLKWITKKDLLCSIWNSAQCYVAVWMGGGGLEENGYIYIVERFPPYSGPQSSMKLVSRDRFSMDWGEGIFSR